MKSEPRTWIVFQKYTDRPDAMYNGTFHGYSEDGSLQIASMHYDEEYGQEMGEYVDRYPANTRMLRRDDFIRDLAKTNPEGALSAAYEALADAKRLSPQLNAFQRLVDELGPKETFLRTKQGLFRFMKAEHFDKARKLCPGFRVGPLHVSSGDHILVHLLYGQAWDGARFYRFRPHGPKLYRWGGGFCGIEFGSRG